MQLVITHSYTVHPYTHTHAHTFTHRTHACVHYSVNEELNPGFPDYGSTIARCWQCLFHSCWGIVAPHHTILTSSQFSSWRVLRNDINISRISAVYTFFLWVQKIKKHFGTPRRSYCYFPMQGICPFKVSKKSENLYFWWKWRIWVHSTPCKCKRQIFISEFNWQKFPA